MGAQQTETKTVKFDEIGQTVVPGALNDTKKIRKAGADIFANFGAEKPWIYPKAGGCSHVVQRYTVRLCGPR